MSEQKPTMIYFGPWAEAGHFLFQEGGRYFRGLLPTRFPWDPWSANNGIDGQLQTGCFLRDGLWKSGKQEEGEALLHHKNGWTALSFWDRSVDKRGGCNSTYFAEGTFTFEQMIQMAKTRFSERWNKMKFEVWLSKKTQ